LPTKLQKRALEVIRKNPTISLYKALVLAGYSEKTALNPTANVVGSKGMANLQDVYKYEIIQKGITPKKLAHLLKKGLKDQDKKTVLAYIDKAEQALELSKEAPDTAIQINLGEDINRLAE
jgi:hypothetical protein